MEKSKTTDFWSGMWKKSNNVTIKLPPTASQESTESSLEPTESVTLNDTQSSTETTPSEASIPSEAPTPAQEEVKRKINIENDFQLAYIASATFRIAISGSAAHTNS